MSTWQRVRRDPDLTEIFTGFPVLATERWRYVEARIILDILILDGVRHRTSISVTSHQHLWE